MSVGTWQGTTGPEMEPEVPQRPGKHKKKWKLALVGLIGIYVLLCGYGLITVYVSRADGTSGAASGAAPTARNQTRASTPAAVVANPALGTAGSPAPHSLGVASVAAFGPEGTSDGDNPGLTSGLLDVATDQRWYSQWYATPEFGGLRSGTGLLLDLGETVTVTDVHLTLGSEPGADVQVRVGNSSSRNMPTVASAWNVSGTIRLTTNSAKGRYVLIWFTRLPPDGHGHYQVSVYTATVDGTAGVLVPQVHLKP